MGSRSRGALAVACLATSALLLAPGGTAELPGPAELRDLGSALLGSVATPGRLARAHADLEGIRRCGECHGLLETTPDARCLHCHEEIEARLAARRGFHSRLEGRCAGCHPDHRGPEADVLGLDRDAFNHEQAEFPLRGAHPDVDCESCHVRKSPDSEREAFHAIGIPHAACSDCHTDPHGEAFLDRRDCAPCHGEESFGAADLRLARSGGDEGFDHDRDTRFPLAGAHPDLACADCHTAERRAEGERRRTAPGRDARVDCAGCHETARALLAGRSDGFSVSPDPHAELACAECHPAAAGATDLLAYQRRCVACHAPEYGSLLFTRMRIVSELVGRIEARAEAETADAELSRLAARARRLARSGAHHPDLAERVLERELARHGGSTEVRP